MPPIDDRELFIECYREALQKLDSCPTQTDRINQQSVVDGMRTRWKRNMGADDLHERAFPVK